MISINTVILLATLAMPGISADTAKTPEIKPPAQTPAVKLSPEEEAAQQLAQWDKKLESLQCSFTQNIKFEDAGFTTKITGRIHYLKPNKLRVEHVLPQRQIVYTDKKTIWIYKPEDSQAIKTSWDDWVKQQNATFAGIADFGAYSSLAQRHNIKVLDLKNGFKEIELTPKSNPKLYRLVLTVSEKDFFPSSIKFDIGKIKTETLLENMEKNGAISADIFKFEPPKGVTVIDLTKK